MFSCHLPYSNDILDYDEGTFNSKQTKLSLQIVNLKSNEKYAKNEKLHPKCRKM